MSRTTEEINKVTGTVIRLSVRLISCAVVLLLLAEGISRGYQFGYDIFASSAAEEGTGSDRTVTVTGEESELDVCRSLEEEGLIADGLAAFFQMKFYDYEIYPGTYTLNPSMTSKEILQVLNQRPENEEENERKTTENEAYESAAEEVTESSDGDVSVEVLEEEHSPETEELPETEENAAEAESSREPETEPEAGIEIRIN